MRGFRNGVRRLTVLSVTILIISGEAKAQLGSFSMSAPPVPLTAGQYGPAGFPSSSPGQSVATDPLGIGGYAGQSNMFNNPFAMPLLYGAMLGMSPNQSSAVSECERIGHEHLFRESRGDG